MSIIETEEVLHTKARRKPGKKDNDAEAPRNKWRFRSLLLTRQNPSPRKFSDTAMEWSTPVDHLIDVELPV
jgi:hypothetical protein